MLKQAGQSSQKLKKNPLSIKTAFSIFLGLCLMIGLIVSQPIVEKTISYTIAEVYFRQKQYDQAEKAFLRLGNYKDSQSYVQESRYQKALNLYNDQRYREAEMIFLSLSDYRDSSRKAKSSRYALAVALFNSHDYMAASLIFDAMPDYQESRHYLNEMSYRSALNQYILGNLDHARLSFKQLGNYKNAGDYVREISYGSALEALTLGKYREAMALFFDLEKYKDSAEQLDKLAIQYPSIILSHGNRNRAEIALTFDDGGYGLANALVILNKRGLKGTFFVLARELKNNPERWRQAIKDGHQVCNHSVHHMMKLPWLTESEMIAEILGWETVAREVLGNDYVDRMKRDFPYFRAPGGNFSVKLQQVLSKTGYPITVYWSREDCYFKTHNYWGYTLVENYVLNAKNGDIFLMHSGTVASLEAIIDGTQARGFRFKQLTELWRK